MDKCQPARHMRQGAFGTENTVKHSAEAPKFSRNEEMAVGAVVAPHVTWHRPPHWPALQPSSRHVRSGSFAPRCILKMAALPRARRASPAQPSPNPAPAPGLLFVPNVFSPSFPLRWSFYKPLQIWVETDFSQLAPRLNFTAQHTLRHCQKLDSVPGKILTVNFPTGIEGTHGSRQDGPSTKSREGNVFTGFQSLCRCQTHRDPQDGPASPHHGRN